MTPSPLKSLSLYDSHMHTALCRHASGEPEQYAAVAHARGLTGIIFTCHNPLPRGLSANVRMKPEQFDQYLALIENTRAQWAGRLDVRLGLECDHLPGEDLADWLESQARSADFDYLLISIHPHLPEYRERFWSGDPVAYQRVYFEHLADAAELGLHDALSHPDLVKNIDADAWRVDRLMDDIRRSLDRIAAVGMAMELNTSGWYKTIAEQNPGSTILREISIREIPIILGSDAHEPARVGDRFLEAADLLEDAGFKRASFFLQRQRHDVPLVDLRARLTD